MTRDEIDRIKELCEAATPGPWEWQSHENRLWSYDTLRAPTGPIVIPDWQALSEIEVASGMDVNDHDAAFIAASRTAVPALLADLEAAEKENKRLREAINEAIAIDEECNLGNMADVLRKAVG